MAIIATIFEIKRNFIYYLITGIIETKTNPFKGTTFLKILSIEHKKLLFKGAKRN